MDVELPEYLPLEEAARRYRLSQEMLARAVEDGRIRAVRVNGRILVAGEDIRQISENRAKSEEIWEQVKHLDGIPIGISEASSKYGVDSTSIYGWINRGYVRLIEDRRGGGRGRKRLVNEADIAYAALVAKHRGRRQGKPILTRSLAPPWSRQ